MRASQPESQSSGSIFGSFTPPEDHAIHVDVYVYMYMYAYIYIHVHACVDVWMCTVNSMHVYMRICISVHMNICNHQNTCIMERCM